VRGQRPCGQCQEDRWLRASSFLEVGACGSRGLCFVLIYNALDVRVGEFESMSSEKTSSENTPKQKAISPKDPFVSIARYSEIGFIIPASVLLGFFLGKLADYWLHTKWLYLVGVIFGAVVGFTQMIRMAFRASKNDK
jgi:F0F1-type ATP synthase assembly protein I